MPLKNTVYYYMQPGCQCYHPPPGHAPSPHPSPPPCSCSLIMAVTIHHLVMDGWSYGVLTEELKTVRRWRERVGRGGGLRTGGGGGGLKSVRGGGHWLRLQPATTCYSL